MHGIFQATGDAVILMMSDFQDPLDLISKYISEWEKGFKVVMAQKDSMKTLSNTKLKLFIKSLVIYLKKSYY